MANKLQLLTYLALCTQGIKIKQEVEEVKSVRSILESSPEFTQDMFMQLLTKPNFPHIFLSDVKSLIKGMQQDFPDMITLDSIGTTWEDRPIDIMTIDAKNLEAV